MIVTSTWVSNGRVRSDARRSCREHDSSLAIGRPYRPGPYYESPPAGMEGSEYLWETRDLFVLAPPHPKQKKNSGTSVCSLRTSTRAKWLPSGEVSHA
jgi:hypothetical protein